MFALAGCPNETPQPTPQPPPALVKYGDLTLSGGGTIPIYKTATVTDAQMAALVDGKNVVQRIQAGYDDSFSNKGNITTTKVSAIHIIASGATPTCTQSGSKWIISLPYNFTASQMRATLNGFGGSDLAD
jgi:hypothetical protein